MSAKLVIINHLYPDKVSAIAAAVPGSVVEAWPSVKEALPHLADADAVAMWGFQNVDPILDAAPHLQWVHSLSDGVERLLTPAMFERDVVLTNSHGVHDNAVSEHTVAFILAWYHRLHEALRSQYDHEWKRPNGDVLTGKRILIAGFGGIGRAIAEKARPFGVTILAVKRTPAPDPLADEMYGTDDVLSVLPTADVVVAALPATGSTDKFFDEKAFAAMKEGALFVNIARASVVDEAALIEALRSGRLAGAALDVFSREPLPADHPFWDMPNVIMTPHTASRTPDSWKRVLALLRDNFAAWSEGRPMANVIDKHKGY